VKGGAPRLRKALGSALLALGLALTSPGATAKAEPAPQTATVEAAQVLVLLRAAPPHFRPGGDYAAGYGDLQGRAARRRLARQIARHQGLTLVTDWPMPVLGLDCFVMQAPPGRSAVEVARQLSAEPGVAWAEPMNLYRTQAATPRDPLFPVQPAARLWRLGDLHELATGENVRVAVIDSRVDAAHPDLQGQVADAEDFVTGHPSGPERHGTGIAGVIAARADGQGIVGIAPGARLLALRACWQGEARSAAVCDSLSLAKALMSAIESKAQVINLSLSGPPTLLLGRLLDAAVARGAAVVSAYDPLLPAGGFPASHPGVIAVSDSPSAPSPVLLAPGRDIPVPEPGGRWGLADGSSFAAAHVSGLLALLRQRGRVSRGAFVLAADRGGARAIDPCASLLRAFGPCACGCARVSDAARR
jgi:subtilisin family serine protease